MTSDTDTYAMLDTRDWGTQPQVVNTRNGHRHPHRPSRRHLEEELQYGELSLKSLNKDWHGVIRNVGNIGEVQRTAGGDETDAKGVFLKSELRSELRRMHRTELEGRLGLSSHKLDDILNRAEARTSHLYKHTIPQHLVNTKGTIHYNAFLEVIQNYRLSSEQETTLKSVARVFAYVEEFTCRPPTLVMILLTLSELCLYLITVLDLTDHRGQPVPVTWTGPVPYCSPLIYNPQRRHEAWRFLSYMFIHVGIGHFVFNMIMQIIVGVSLEMEQTGYLGSFKVLLVYMSGVIAGSLGTSLSDPGTFLAGASGGVYALIAAHLATMLLNFREDANLRIRKVVKKPVTMIIRTSFILLLTVHDVGFAIYVRLYDPDNRTGFMGHLCGALAGLTVGLFLLDNRRVRSWEPVIQWLALFIFMAGIVFSIVWNIMGNTWSPGFYPALDTSNISDCRNHHVG